MGNYASVKTYIGICHWAQLITELLWSYKSMCVPYAWGPSQYGRPQALTEGQQGR